MVVVVVVVVVVVSDACLDVRCVWSQRHGDAMSPRTNLHVAGHLESDSRRPRHPGEPSTTKNSSSSRARKTGAQLRDNLEERENDAKCVKKTPTLLQTVIELCR